MPVICSIPIRSTLVRSTLVAAALALGAPAVADHPGADLDQAMFDREKYFQPIDAPAPGFTLQDAEGNAVSLADLDDKVVVLAFIYATCPDLCPLHSAKLAELQAAINASPMKDMVEFVAVTTDPANDTPEVLEAYGPAHGLDPANWTFLTSAPDAPEDSTRKLAETYALQFTPADGIQTHAAATHVIDRGRLAARFHGLDWDTANAALYINGLINNAAEQGGEDGGWFGRVRGLLQ